MADFKLETLMNNLESVAAKPVEVDSIERLNEVLAGIISDREKIYCPRDTDLEKQIHIPEEKLAPDIRSADASIEEVFGAIAETGSIICVSAKGRDMETSLLPIHHVAIVDRERLFETLEDFFAQVDDQPPRNITLITGPSRTADIELTLSVGVHGPERLDVIVI
jgi:L-lactate dehydrogenase complex protein LldG